MRGVSFEVAAGEVFGFLGPNGAGKTTTINMLCTLAQPDRRQRARRRPRRRARARRRPPQHRPRLPGPDARRLPDRRAEPAAARRAVRRRVRSSSTPRMQQVLEMVGLWERRDGAVLTFSGGMRRRLEIARGLMHSPRVLFLDEPTIGLDPQTRSSIWRYIRELQEREEITIFMTTHYMDEAEFCDRIAIMDQRRDRRARHARGAEGAASARTACGSRPTTTRRRSPRWRERFGIEATIVRGRGDVLRARPGEEFVPRLFAELGLADPLGQRVAADARRRLHVLHGLDDPRRRGVRQRGDAQPDDDAGDDAGGRR